MGAGTACRAQPQFKLPVVLSAQEVRLLLAKVQLPEHRAALATIYSCGLRLGEALRLEVKDVDAGRMLLHKRFGSSMPLRQRQVLQRLLRCRTAALGGALFVCPECGLKHFRYHSCNDRHCPRCGQADADQWLAKQSAWLLPVDYFLVETALGNPQSGRRIGPKRPALSEPVCL